MGNGGWSTFTGPIEQWDRVDEIPEAAAISNLIHEEKQSGSLTGCQGGTESRAQPAVGLGV